MQKIYLQQQAKNKCAEVHHFAWYFRCETNCLDEDSDEANNNNVANNVENEAGVQQVSEVGDNNAITIPPDNIIAKEIQAIEISKCKNKASTSSSNIKASRVHIQDPKA